MYRENESDSCAIRGDAKVAELADAPDLGSGGRKAMGVQVPPFAPISHILVTVARISQNVTRGKDRFGK